MSVQNAVLRATSHRMSQRRNILKTLSESKEQIFFFDWLSKAYPHHLEDCYHIPNQTTRTAGEGMKLKRMGKLAGIPDVFCSLPRGKYHGLYIEFKKTSNSRASEDQVKVMSRFTKNGYKCEIARGWVNAAEIFKQYMRQINET